MAEKSTRLIKIESWHDASVESFRCGWCGETFVFAAIMINFCPNCGTDYDGEDDETAEGE